MSEYKIGDWITTKELGKVRVYDLKPNGEIDTVQRFDKGEKEPVYIKIETLIGKTITVIGFLAKLWLQISDFWKSTFKK